MLRILTDHGPVGRWYNLLRAGRELDPGLLGVRVVGDDRGVVSRTTGHTATVTGLLLNVADLGAFGHCSNGENVPGLEDSCKRQITMI